MKNPPQVFTFYSFKGGVGRSMAVLNLAYALAAKGRHVLLFDMDLEAPGLSGFLHREAEIAGFARLDMVDLVRWAFSASLPLDPVSFPTASDYVVPIAPEKLAKVPRSFSQLGRLDIIPVEEDRDYYERLTSLAIGNYDQDDLVRAGSVLRAWLKSLRFPIDVPDYYGPECERTASYDYVLVDSRTGITETGGLCIGPLSDQLVILTALNDQNVAGTRKFLTEVGIFDDRGGPAPESKPYLVVASLVPTGEIEQKRRRLEQIEQSLGKAIVILSYHPQLALKETIFTRDHPGEYLAHEYDELLQQVLRRAGDWVDDEVMQTISNRPRSSPEFCEVLRRLLGLAWIPGLAPFLSHLLSTTNFADISHDADYILWDLVCNLLSHGEPTFRLTVVNNWANLLSEWARSSKDPELADLRLEAAMTLYEAILQSEQASTDHKAIARYNRGVRHVQRGEPAKAIADFNIVIQMEGATAEQKARALVNRGGVYRQLANAEKAIADFTAVIELADAPVDQNALARLNRGVVYSQLGDPEKAIEDYASAIQILDASIEQKAAPVFAFGPRIGHPGSEDVVIPYFVAGFQVPDGRIGQIGQRALALLGHGAALTQLAQPEKAIADFTAVIDMAAAPPEHKAKAQLGRGMTYGQLSESEKAIADFTAVIETTNVSDQNEVLARLGRATTYDLVGEAEKAVADYTAVMEKPATPADQRTLAQFSRGLTYAQRGEENRAIADLTAVVQMASATSDQKAMAFLILGLAHGERGELAKAISEFTTAIAIPNVSAATTAVALVNRGVRHVELGELDEAIADYTAVEQMQEGLADLKAKAVFFRGLTHFNRGEAAEAIIDFTAAIGMPEIPADQQARVLFSRAVAYGLRGEYEKAIADFATLIEMPDDRAKLKGNALFIRGSTYSQIGELEKATADLGAVVETVAAPDELKARALHTRGAIHVQKSEPKQAIADYTAVIGMDKIPVELKAQALFSRGETYHKQDQPEAAIADCTAVIEMNDSPTQLRAMALCGRGWLRFLAGDYDEAIADGRQAVSLNPGRWTAHGNLAIALLAKGEDDEALLVYNEALALAEVKNLDEMDEDLRKLARTHGSSKGIDEALARIQGRKRSQSH